MIIYFSGSGNSFSVARGLAEILNDQAIHIKHVNKINTHDERMIGIVYPCYYGDLPAIVKDSIKNTTFSSVEYIFGITVHGGDPGNCLYVLQKLLKEKGSDLSYGEEILMPVNSRIKYGRITTDIETRVNEGRKSIKRIAQEINKRKINSMEIKRRIIPTITTKLPIITIDRKFWVKKVDTGRCTQCGICQKVCSLKNIKVMDDGINIGNNCTDCLACVHWCPEAAIGFRNRKVRKEQQYHHPDVSLKDMIFENLKE